MKTSGKKVTFLDSNIFLDKSIDDTFVVSTESRSIPDIFRFYSGKYWTVADNILSQVKNTDTRIYIEPSDNDVYTVVANKTQFITDYMDEKGIPRKKFDIAKWEEFVDNVLTPTFDTTFQDFYFEIPELVDIKDKKDTGASALNYINHKFVYNFYSGNYEALLSESSTDINVLPSISTLVNDPQLGTRTYEENVVLTLGANIPDDYAEALFLGTNKQAIKEYFDIYSKVYRNDSSKLARNLISTFPRDVKVDSTKLSRIKNFKYVPFPFYVDFNFTNLANSKDDFVHAISEIGGVRYDLEQYLISNKDNHSNKFFIKNNEATEEVEIKLYDLKQWLQSGLDGQLDIIGTNDPRDLPRSLNTLAPVEYTNTIKYIKDNLKNKKRNYVDFLNKASPTELIAYKIEKRQYKYNSTDVLQTFWLYPSSEESIKYIDTQIKYGVDYYYTVSAYALVAGNEYSYSGYDYKTNTKQKDQDIKNGNFKIKIKNNISYKILEIPISRFHGSVHESPPTKPQLKISKYGQNIKLELLDSEQDSLEKFNFIENKEFSLFEKIKESQDNYEKDKIYSKLSDELQLQIYKTINKPIDHLSFQGKLYKTLNINNINSFTDGLTENVKYYYLFRYLNSHGTPSNVSQIYEIELKDEDGYSYLDVNMVDLEKQPARIQEKNLKRYLLVRPSIIQTRMTTGEQIITSQDINLGPDRQSAWQKSFILRIKSKKTNRIIELNIKPIINRQKD